MTLDQTVTPNKTTNYYYAGDFVYRSAATGSPDTLEFISHPEGRLRPVRIDTTQSISIANLKYIYDYYLKDHLGSVRSVLTTEQQTDLYAATMETANAGKENALFSNVSSTAVQKPAGFSNDNNNQKASKLNGAVNISGNKRVGPSIILKVMTGDTISISAYSWYTGAVQPAATGVSAIATELIPFLTSGVGGLNGSKTGAVPTTFSGPLLTSDIATLLSSDSTTYVNTRPKAFLNWMVVGEDYVAATSSPNHVNAIQIPTCNAGDTLKQVVGPANMVVRRNGWIYIYLSNESAQDVYFDNLVINLRHGPVVEQKDYYAFGMENPALATKAAKTNYFPNKYDFTSQLLDEDLGLNFNDFRFRNYDPQIARFVQTDPLASKFVYNSTFAYAENRPSSGIDLEGKEFVGLTLDAIEAASDLISSKIDQYTGSMEAASRIATGTSGQPTIPGSGPVQSLQGSLNRLSDQTALTAPAIDVFNATVTLASFTPVTEAGLPAMISSELAFSTTSLETKISVATDFKLDASSSGAIKLDTKSPGFLVDRSGTAFPVPKGASGPVPVINDAGNRTGTGFVNGSGGANGQVSTMRVMNPTKPTGKSPGYPNGYVRYHNRNGQAVNPYTGKPGTRAETHYPLNP
jgi:RHS repeat-associated protein